jgi:hypothetical protein
MKFGGRQVPRRSAGIPLQPAGGVQMVVNGTASRSPVVPKKAVPPGKVCEEMLVLRVTTDILANVCTDTN